MPEKPSLFQEHGRTLGKANLGKTYEKLKGTTTLIAVAMLAKMLDLPEAQIRNIVKTRRKAGVDFMNPRIIGKFIWEMEERANDKEINNYISRTCWKCNTSIVLRRESNSGKRRKTNSLPKR